ncbi:MAG: glycoside hydrolase family 13 protein [Alistipes sp.]|nr:glycoside hydrolase family 13 protein [Alistipes sp.]
MRRFFSLICFVMLSTLVTAEAAKPKTTIKHVEPLSWWVGMNTPLQLLINGENIGAWSVEILPANQGVSVSGVHTADSPNYLFVDVDIEDDAVAGDYTLRFTNGKSKLNYIYTIAERVAGSAERKSFTTADFVYLIMPDRFANGDTSNDSTDDTIEKVDRSRAGRRHGGDIQGIIDHLDYIADLGATAIWSTPLLLDNENGASYHGYSCSDYYRIDPRYGSNELFKSYVEECHKRDLKVIMDIVPNHSSTSHWWYADQPFEDWTHKWESYTQSNWTFSTNMDFNASKSDLYQMESGWFDRSMADMNLDNVYLLNYFKQWAVWWIEYSGLDGFRVDTYPYNEKMPMSQWCKAVMEEYPNFNIVGEVWTSSIPQLAYWQGGNYNKDGFNSHLKSIMDFPLHDAIRAAMTEGGARGGWGKGMTRIYDVLSHDFVYHDLQNMMIMAGNHDTDRVGDVVEGDARRMKLVAAMLCTMRGMPQMLYGDELMFRSTDRSKGHPTLRVDFPGGWEGDAKNLFDRAQHTGDEKDVFDYTHKLMNWRKSKDVIHNGRTLHFIDRDNTYAYFRYNDSEVVFVYINNSDDTREVAWERYAEISEGLTEGRDVITGESVTMQGCKVAPATALIVEFKR